MSLLMKTNSSFCELGAFVNEIPREALAASVEMALKDHENGNTVSHSELMSRIKAERGWK